MPKRTLMEAERPLGSVTPEQELRRTMPAFMPQEEEEQGKIAE
jgi:hypothetical protein